MLLFNRAVLSPDIDECENRNDNDCYKICENTMGSYKCLCPPGFHGDGRRDGERCSLSDIRDNLLSTKITVGKYSSNIFLSLVAFGQLKYGPVDLPLSRMK